MSVAGKHYLVTGGTGFIGSALVITLVKAGARVRSLDDDSRGSARRLQPVAGDIELISGDIRDPDIVARAMAGVDGVFHLAYVNGTEFFYTKPDLVLDIAVRGMMNVVDAAIRHSVREFVLASTSEVYQTPPHVPTDETVPLSVPDPLNPRYSYGGGKIICELLAVNFGRKHFERTMIFRPHNVYGPDMGWEHVIPQFAVRLNGLMKEHPSGVIPFPIQGSGRETRSFVFIDDMIDGIMHMMRRGENLGIYHVGTSDEVSIAELAEKVGKSVNRTVTIVPGDLRAGGTLRRCPDVTKLKALGYAPSVSLEEGLRRTVPWYFDHDPTNGAR